MRFLVDQALFADSTKDALLWTFLLATIAHEHTVLLRPSWRSRGNSPIHVFLTRATSAPLVALIRRTFERSLDEFRSGLNSQPLHKVGPGSTSDELPATDAARLAWTPLWLALENGRNDLAFLQRALPHHHRSWLARQIQRGQIEVPPSGGTGELKMLLENLATSPDHADHFRALRLWVMFDHDADPTDISAPSPISKELGEIARQKNIPFIRLGRRTMENYLPPTVLKDWQEYGTNRKERTLRAKKVAAFNRLSPAQKRAFNWKEGLLKDIRSTTRKEYKDAKISKRKEKNSGDLLKIALDLFQAHLSKSELPSLFQTIQSEEDAAVLMEGFGHDIGESWMKSIKDADIDSVFEQDPEEKAWRARLAQSLRGTR